MAEIKNSFLKSKMNKDLDDRLIPNGEYRDAQNISVGKSEADDIGALETVLGNIEATDLDLNIANLEIIGAHVVESRNSIILFLTDYDDDPLVNTSGPVFAPLTGAGSNHYIYEFNPPTGKTALVSGNFLNFSKSFPITGISVIEDLLFFTDNRNQPRKINLNLANNSYYFNESSISVAKYNPYQPINVLNKVTTPTTTNSSTATLAIADTTGIYKGMLAVQYGNTAMQPQDYLYVTTVNTNTSVVLNDTPATVNADDVTFLATTMTGENITFDFNSGSADEWPGDPDYLEDKFVRFSYRFQFDDGEYSLMAPFTQIAFIPKQKGYFLSGNEDDAYRSTIIEFMENGVQNVELHIPLPDIGSKVIDNNSGAYKIQNLQILYKESDGRAVKVLDTIQASEWKSDYPNSNIYTYQYQSRKPFRTLPENQTIRVYDKVPVKALAQETAGNRIIYGNFKNKYTPPPTLDYLVGTGDKSQQEGFDNWAEYPSHSLKQNRNYQVGFVLIDKFGRQSDVVLSSVRLLNLKAGNTEFGGDTMFHAYNTSSNQGTIRDWFGDTLKVKIDTPISSGSASSTPLYSGQPGLYARQQGNGYNSYNGTTADQPSISGNTYIFKIGATYTDIPAINTYLEGEYTDYVKVTNVQADTPSAGKYTITTDGQVSSTYLQQGTGPSDVKYSYLINPVGWYSYKIVVKQQEQDYYNVYLPGILKGYPDQTGTPPAFPTDPSGSTANIVLINDNINKVPRDLSEVGPEQKQFRSSVQLYARVENDSGTTNEQFFPGILSDTAISISTASDSNMTYSDLGTNGRLNFYQIDTNPLIARIDTTAAIGVTTATMRPILAVYETEPQESLLDIFWETSTTGLISELNDAILSDFDGPVGWSSYNSNSFTESSAVTSFITGLSPVDAAGANITASTISNVSYVNDAGQAVSNLELERVAGPPVTYNVKKLDDDFVFNNDPDVRNFTITADVTKTGGGTGAGLAIDISLQNTQPIINGGVALPSISTQSANTGTLATITGTNGASDATLRTQQLKWSITAGNNNNYFSINETTGVLSKDSNSAATVGTHTLTIKLEDAYNNGSVATGSENQTAPQQIVVSSSVIGNAFTSSPSRTASQILSYCGSGDPGCGSVTYYNQTSLAPTAGDEIRTGPNGTNSPLLAAGYYSYSCGGSFLNYFKISNNNGLINTDGSGINQCS